MDKLGKTYVTLVIDKSSSMMSIREDIIKMYNAQLSALAKEAKKSGIETVVSLITFSNEHKIVHDNVDVSNIKPLESEDYIPSGTTALYDTIVFVTEKQLKEHKLDKNDSALLIIMTDGQENSSVKHGGEKGLYYVKGMLDAVKFSDQWTITFLGTEEALADIKDVNFGRGQMFSFATTPDAILNTSHVLTQGIENYYSARTTGSTATNNFFGKEETPPKNKK